MFVLQNRELAQGTWCYEKNLQKVHGALSAASSGVAEEGSFSHFTVASYANPQKNAGNSQFPYHSSMTQANPKPLTMR
jgi:hypothetical protein